MPSRIDLQGLAAGTGMELSRVLGSEGGTSGRTQLPSGARHGLNRASLVCQYFFPDPATYLNYNDIWEFFGESWCPSDCFLSKAFPPAGNVN